MRRMCFIFAIIFFATANVAFAAMTSTNYQILWDAVDSGGNEIGTSTNYLLRDTIGGNAMGSGTSTNYQLSAGYRAGDGGDTLSLDIGAIKEGTSSNYSGFQLVAKQVSVSSTLPYAVGEIIAVVENVGLSQMVAVGKITSIVGSDLHVDAWAGDQALMSVNPIGGNDFVYDLNATAIVFGTVNPGSAGTYVAYSSVQTNAASGYSVYVQADKILQNASANMISSVADGTVSTGSEEYGASVTGATAFGAGVDTAVTTTQRVVQASAVATGSTPDRVAMTYKVAVTSGTISGAYSQTIYYTVTANY